MKRAVLLFLLILCVLPFLSNPQTTPATERASTPTENNHFTPSGAGDDYVDSRYSITYGTTTTDPPAGMGNVDAACTNMTEANIGTATVFGQSDTSASYYQSSANYLVGSVFTMGADSSVITDAHFYARGKTGTVNCKVIIVTHSTMTILVNGVSNPVSVTTTAEWKTATWTTPPTLAANTAYVLMVVSDGTFYFYYLDTSALGHTDTSNSYTTPTDPTDYTHSNYQWSIYVHYTPVFYGFQAIFAFATVDYNSYYDEGLWFDFDASSTAETIEVYGGTSTNPTTLIADAKNTDFSVDIHATLTGATYYIKIVDELRSTDTDADVWKVAKCYIKLTNTAPVNVGTPTCADVDDTNNIYSMYEYYSIIAHISDADGYANIHYIDLYLYNDIRSTTYWTMRYHEDDNTFNEQSDASDYVDISGSSATRSGNTIDASFEVRPHFNHPAVTVDDFRVLVYDADAASDDDYYETNWDWVPTLEYDVTPTVTSDVSGTVDRGDRYENFHITGDVSYAGSTLAPPSSAIDIWVSGTEYGSNPGPWETDTINADGTFTCECYADNQVGQDTYTIKTVAEDAGSGGTDLITGADPTDTYIADIAQVKWIVANGTYFELGESATLTVGLQYDYDDTAITAGTFSLVYGTSFLTLSHLSAGNWTVIDSSANATSRTYNTVNGTATLHGVAWVGVESKSATCHWDRILLTVAITRNRTVIGYNVSISVSGVYDNLGYQWNGTATLNSTWAAPFYSSYSTANNRSFIVTSITNDDMSLVGFSSNDAWCIWDDVIATSSPTYSWMQYDIDTVWLIWGTVSTWEWDVNGTCLTQGTNLVGHANASEKARSAIWSATGNFGGLSIGEFNPSWYFVNISVNVETTINGQAYDWIVWTVIISVDITHTVQLVAPSVDVQDNWITFYYTTNYGNATLIIWDNDTLVGYSQWEGAYQIAKPTVVGLHNYTLLYNATHTGAGYADQVKDFSDSDLWLWQNWKYTVNPVQLSFDEVTFSQSNESVVITGRVWTSANHLHYTVYEASLGWTSGTISGVTSGSWLSWMWAKSSVTSTSNFTVAVTDGSYNVTFRGFYIRISGNSWIIYGGSAVGDTTYVQNSTIIYQNPQGLYMDQATAAFFTFGIPTALFFAYLMHRISLKKAVLKAIKKEQRT